MQVIHAVPGEGLGLVGQGFQLPLQGLAGDLQANADPLENAGNGLPAGRNVDQRFVAVGPVAGVVQDGAHAGEGDVLVEYAALIRSAVIRLRL